MGVALSLKGDHQSSLELFQKNIPLTRQLGTYYPCLYFDSLNSLAVELNEDSQTEYATHIIKEVAKSPYYSLYPEWQHSYNEILTAHSASKPRKFFPGFRARKPLRPKQTEQQIKRIEQAVSIASYLKEHPDKALLIPADQDNTNSVTSIVRPFRPKHKYVRRQEYKLFLDMVLIDKEGRESLAYSMEMDNYPIQHFTEFFDSVDTISIDDDTVGVEILRLQVRLVTDQNELIEVLREDCIVESEIDTLFSLFEEVDSWVVQPFFEEEPYIEKFYRKRDADLLETVIENLSNERK
jgi:hypothetical protein